MDWSHCSKLLIKPDGDPFIDVRSIEDIVRRAMSGETISSGDISDISHRNPFYGLLAEDSALDAFRMLVNTSGLHRVCVIEEDQVVGILSKTDIVRFLWQKMMVDDPRGGSLYLRTMLKRSLRAAALGDVHPVVTATHDERVLDVLERMSRAQVSSVPVLDQEDGKKIIGNLSMADIRVCVFHHLCHY